MKKLIKYLFIGTLLISCSPKYSELNDQGFGGGFSHKGLVTTTHGKITLESNEIQFTIAGNDLSLSGYPNNAIPRVNVESKNTILNPSKLIKSKLQKISIFKHRVKELFRPVKKTKQNGLSFPDKRSSKGKWVLLILGIINIILGLSIFIEYNAVYQSPLAYGLITAFETFMRALGLVVAVLGLIMLIIGLLID